MTTTCESPWLGMAACIVAVAILLCAMRYWMKDQGTFLDLDRESLRREHLRQLQKPTYTTKVRYNSTGKQPPRKVEEE